MYGDDEGEGRAGQGRARQGRADAIDATTSLHSNKVTCVERRTPAATPLVGGASCRRLTAAPARYQPRPGSLALHTRAPPSKKDWWVQEGGSVCEREPSCRSDRVGGSRVSAYAVLVARRRERDGVNKRSASSVAASGIPGE